MVQKVILFLLLINLDKAQPSTSKESYYKKAQMHTKERAWDSALSLWRMLLIIERDSVAKALIYHQLGYIALHRGDSADALSLWENALRFHPTYLSAALNYQWLRLRYRPPATPTMTLRKYYDNFPPPSEKAPPHLGGKGAIVLEVPRWLSVVRMKE